MAECLYLYKYSVMKKILLSAAVIGFFAASCSKKEANPLQDSNVMLQEPEVKVVDTAKKAAIPATPVPAATSTATSAPTADAAKKDSAK